MSGTVASATTLAPSAPTRARSTAGASRTRPAVAIALALCVSCAPDAGPPAAASALAQLEQFGFVPAGRTSLSLDSPRGSTPIAIDEPLLVGMYEVTRSEFQVYRAAARPALDPLLVQRFQSWPDADGALPMSFVTRAEAEDFARWAGVRLPTASEWLFCAISRRRFAYPWGDSWQQGRANTLELRPDPAPTPVGTFEGGRTATHLYDMLGNVWEWVADEGDDRATALGGSYFSYKRELHLQGTYFSESLSSGSRLDDVGFRVCVPASEWLRAHAGALERGDGVRVRLQSVGRRWGVGAVQLLSALAEAASGSARSALESILSGARG